MDAICSFMRGNKQANKQNRKLSTNGDDRWEGSSFKRNGTTGGPGRSLGDLEVRSPCAEVGSERAAETSKVTAHA